MDLLRGDTDLEALNKELNDPGALVEYMRPYDKYAVSMLPYLLGGFLVWSGNLVYGREPSYLKFRAVEVIARVPYHSWASAAYTLLTLCYTNEKKSLQLSNISKYASHAQDNETMHVIVVSQLARAEERAGLLRHTLIPMIFAFFYFWWSYVLYLINPRYSYELNYLFESHAFQQYDRFLETRGEELKKKSAECEFLTWYGRYPRNQYELFLSIRNDEIIHRNTSIKEIEVCRASA
ncbi:MAG: alternative oxidase [Candidatus Paceibacterota bacterium]